MEWWLTLPTQFTIGSMSLDVRQNHGQKWNKLMKPENKFVNNLMLLTCSKKSEIYKKLQLVWWTKINVFVQCLPESLLLKKHKDKENFYKCIQNSILLHVKSILLKIIKFKIIVMKIVLKISCKWMINWTPFKRKIILFKIKIYLVSINLTLIKISNMKSLWT